MIPYFYPHPSRDPSEPPFGNPWSVLAAVAAGLILMFAVLSAF